MRMVTGFIPPSAGSVKVGGFDMLENPLPAKRLIGYLPENAPAYSDMTVLGFLNFAAELRGLRGENRKKAVDRVIDMCFLESVVQQSIETLSKGYRHRTCFAQSILHDPDVLIMDEPTDGLDPNQKHEVRNLIRRMGEKKAIIFSTHILEEVEAVCSRAIIIDRGRIVANGTPAQLKQRSAHAGCVSVCVRDLTPEVARQKLEQIASVRSATVLRQEKTRLWLRVLPKGESQNGELARSIAELLVKERLGFEELHTEEGRLDEVFRAITRPETPREEQK
jgi:ABC-2 type transport system ATP-binding protein